jgi:hypothetical protein
VPDGAGGWKEQRILLKSAAVVAAPAEIGPGPPSLRRPRGDAALKVLLVLVVSHLRAVTEEVRVLQAAQLLAAGLKIGVSDARGGPANAVEAMRARLNRYLRAERTDVHERAMTVARTLGLRVRPA